MVHITAFCRICLSTDVNMHSIAHTPLQEVYEKLTNIALHTEMRPTVACYICFARLRNSYKLMEDSLRAEKLLHGILENSQDATDELVISNQNNLLSICVTPVEYITGEDDDDDVKNEPIIDIVKAEETIVSPNHYTPLSEIDDRDFSDSDDDIPLKSISLKQEEEEIKKKKVGKTRSYKSVKINATEIILTKEEQMEELLARSKTANYIDSPFKCDLCYKGFVDAQAYENHKEKHDERSGGHACAVCRMRYVSVRQLRSHAHAAHCRLYRCNECGHRSHTKNQAREHDKWHKGYTYECKLCGQTFRKPTSYLTHMRKSHPTEHVCEICGDSFVGRHGLIMHKSKTHRQNQKIKPAPGQNASESFCSDCNIQFVTRHAWERHILSSFKHKLSKQELSSQESSECPVCRSYVSGSLAAHLREHARSLKPTVTVTERALRLPCDECGVEFSSRSRLAAHTRRAHLGLKYNKDIVCELCGKHCTSNATLKYHQRTHTGEKPFKCSSCPKRFSSSNHLNIHTRTHTGEKPYGCGSCGKRFTQKPALNRHQRVHTGVKPYECQYCSKKFSQSNSLNIHIKSVHLKLPNVRKKAEVKQEDLPVM